MPTSLPIIIVGATGTGKSELAHAWARPEGAAILALDAIQVYRGADLGTSKPTPRERAEVPYGGLDQVNPGEPYDVARYLAHAADFIAAQAAQGRALIVVGGTGLYFRALTRGLCLAPATPPALRNELQKLSVAELTARLRLVDRPMSELLLTQNPRRLARAIGVMESTGRSLLAWQAETPPPLLPHFRAVWLQRSRAELVARLKQRLVAMLHGGWPEEVTRLAACYGAETIRAFPAIGYRRLLEVAERGEPVAAAQGDILVATRQYAKRQLTWFTREPKLLPVILSGNATPETVRPLLL